MQICFIIALLDHKLLLDYLSNRCLVEEYFLFRFSVPLYRVLQNIKSKLNAVCSN